MLLFPPAMDDGIKNDFPDKSSKNLLFSNIRKHVDLGADEENLVLCFFNVTLRPRKTLFLQQGNLCRRFYFVQQGSVRAFHTNLEGKESTIMFAVEDWWITDMGAFLNEQAASISLETLDDSLLFEIDSEALEKMLFTLPKMEKYFRISYQRAYVREQQRVLDAISCPVEERYLRFLEKYPKIVKKITQKQIASCLGVTPEFLSTVKNRIGS